MEHLILHNLVPALMLAGNATLIFRNPKTGGRRQYHIVENKECTKHHVSWVMAPGTEAENKVYIGTIVNNKWNPIQHKEAINFGKLYHSVFAGRLNPEMEVMHTGKCCACGRELTDPESIALGIGPYCGGRQ